MRHLFSSSSPFPIPETVYDYYLDENFTFQPWTNLVNALNIPKGESTVNLLIPTSVTAAYTHIFSILNSANKSILLIGNSGAGKSAIISMHLSNLLRKQEIELVTANFSARTTSLKAQQYIEAKLEKKSVGVYSGRSQKKLFIFFDDVNMPSKDQFGTQPTIELLRQLQDKQGFYDRNKLLFKTISNYFMICVASNPAVKEVTPRFIRHFNVLYLSDPSRATLSYIFTTVLSHHFEKTFAETVRKSIPVIISSTIDLFQRVTVKLKPTPSKFHYNFNQRDIGKVIQGMTLSTNVTVPSLEKVTKLWLNETCRVFYDRLATPQDRNWFIKSANSVAMKYYKVSFLTDDWLETHPLMFSNLSSIDTDTPLYEEVGDRKKLKKFIEDRLEDFNSKNRQKMNLEIFEEAMEHIVRICKGIYQYRSNMMLIGVGGSGKQSLAALSSFLLSYEQCSLNLTKNYNIEDFHNDLKKMMEIAAVVHQPVTFVFTDSLMVYDAFLEDINALINSGEISDLFNEEEIENILNQLRPELVDKLGILDTKESLYSEFIARVRNNLHVIISTSPIGETLRNRCRMFPAFVNCCTIDWFESWPEEALVSVALSKFDKLSSSYKSLSIIASKIHLSSQNTSNLYFDQLKRISYVTPKLFFDFIELFTLYFNQKNSELLGKKKKLSNGLEKLHETRKLIAELQIKLQEMIPDLEIQKKKAEVYYQEVQKETSAAIELQLVVEKETEFIEMQAQECKLRAEDAEKDLAETMPVLESAIKAVQALEKNKKDIIEFKKYLKPPEAVKTVMEAVCILLNERSDWTNAVSVLGQMDFLQRLINYNRESVTNSIFKKLRGIVSRPEFQPEIVAQSSEAARSLCIWSIAMYKFTEAFQLVKPKREKVFSMQVKLKSDMEKLENKQEELQQVEKKVKVLKDECAITESKVLGLEKDIKITIERVKRAELLLELLAEEGIKWNETLEVLENSLKYVEGETIANAGYACYLGVYCDEYRTSLKSSWSSTIKALNINLPENYSFITSMGKPIKIRDWQICGLPKDTFSTENSIISMNSLKWPMLIDPQEQARRWLKSTEKSEGLITIKSSKSSTKENKDTVRLLEIGITQGKPMIIEDVSETLDSSISSILSKKTYKKDDGRTVIKLGDHELSYDKNFRLYLLCKASNPNYLPDVFGTLNVINFTVTVPGLEDQLLVEVVRLENPKLEKERDGIVVSLAGDQKLLEETQNSILDMIADSQGYILDNLALVSALQRSKSTSKDITKRVEATVVIETRINASRDSFKDIAIRGTVLYFVISQIPGINPMYQYSLSFITKIFCSAIQNTVGTEDRVAKIIENVTRVIYLVVCRGLFQSDKKLLGFLFATAIARNNNTINTHAWNTFIRGGGVINKKNPKKNPLIGKISEVQWDLVCKIESKINNFNGIADDMINYSKTWSEYITGDIVYSVIPNRYNLIDTFSKILLIKVLRPEKLIYFIDIYTQEILGKEFLNASTSDIEPLFEENDKKTPILFILSQGTDPIESITKICKEKSMIERLQMISLGQGQGTKAQDSFDKSKSQGYWLLLQNCHLAKSWLPALESLIETLQDDTNVHKDFRLILTSMPSDYFPIPILQNSLKVTTEPPSGIKSNMLKVFLQAHSAFSADSARPEVLKKIIFSISFFHSLVMERRKFGALGFNIRYDFNESDFITSVKLMKLLVEENEEIPWEGIQYIIGNINYGGRVTDVNDRLCLMAIFNKCCNSDMLDEPFFFTENEVYRIPTDLDYVQYIKNLPDFDLPEVFGLNNNAQITLESQLTDNLVSCLLKTQPKEITSEALDLDKVVHGLSKSLSISLPEVVDLRIAHPDLTVTDSKGSIPSLSTFLFQELEKFNRLLETMKKTLKDLRNAIKGKVIMTDNLTDMYSSLLNSIIPKLWQEVSYPSIQSLGPWISDLTSRIKFMFDWLKYGSQNCYWLSGFFFPQSFLTAVLQTYSRKFNDPIDELTFSYNVTNFTLQNFVKTKSNGVFVYGLYLEGARWDFSEMALADAFDREIYFNMPLIEFLPVKDNVSREGDYMCPVYKTPKRSGILSSTGLSTNFIVYVDLASDENPDKWTLLGTALLCQIND